MKYETNNVDFSLNHLIHVCTMCFLFVANVDELLITIICASATF